MFDCLFVRLFGCVVVSLFGCVLFLCLNMRVIVCLCGCLLVCLVACCWCVMYCKIGWQVVFACMFDRSLLCLGVVCVRVCACV